MHGHAQKCVERFCEIGKQNDRNIAHSVHALLGLRNEELETGRTICSLLAHRVQMTVSSSHWPTGHFV